MHKYHENWTGFTLLCENHLFPFARINNNNRIVQCERVRMKLSCILLLSADFSTNSWWFHVTRPNYSSRWWLRLFFFFCFVSGAQIEIIKYQNVLWWCENNVKLSARSLILFVFFLNRVVDWLFQRVKLIRSVLSKITLRYFYIHKSK